MPRNRITNANSASPTGYGGIDDLRSAINDDELQEARSRGYFQGLADANDYNRNEYAAGVKHAIAFAVAMYVAIAIWRLI